MSRYRQGRQKEYKVIHALEDLGFITIRSAGSKGAVDVIGLRPELLVFVQVKSATPVSHAEWNRLYEWASWVGAVPVVAEALSRKPVSYFRVIGPHRERSREWPCVEWFPDKE